MQLAGPFYKKYAVPPYCGPTACKRKVSGSLSLPSRGSFHLSFTVLCAIGHWVVFSLGGWSPRLPTRFHVPRGTLDPAALSKASPTGLSPSPDGFPKTVRLPFKVACAVHNPGMHASRFGLLPFRSPLLRESNFPKEIFSFSSSGYLDVSVRRVPLHTLCVGVWMHRFPCAGFPIQRSPDQRVFAPPRSLSQLITSFIGSQCQGIRLTLFVS